MKGENGSIPAFARDILRTLEAAGSEAYCVGGCVRDTLLGRTPGDWDITTSARPEETLALFGAGCPAHGAAARDGHRPDGLTEARRSPPSAGTGTTPDHRHPESVDFHGFPGPRTWPGGTSPSMPWPSPSGGSCGTPSMAGRTWRRGASAAWGNRRGASGRTPCASSGGCALRRCWALPSSRRPLLPSPRRREDLRAIAPERIFTEVRKLLAAERPSAVLREFPEVFGVFWPELLPMLGYDQRNFHHCYDLWEHTLHALDAVPGEEALRFAALFHDVGKPDCFSLDAGGVGHFYGHAAKSAQLADAMLARLRAPNALREEVTELIRRHDTPLPGIPEANLRRLLRRLGEARLRRLIALQRADNLAQAPEYRAERAAGLDEVLRRLDAILQEDACFSLRQLAVNGRDLLALGLRGAEIGRALDFLLNEVVEGRLPNEQEALLAAVWGRDT